MNTTKENKAEQMKAEIRELYMRDPKAACQRALRRTSGMEMEERMERINELLGMHGVEAIRGEWQNGYWCDVVATYCNAGGTYDLTVICERQWNGSARYFVGSWGDFVERNQERLGIQ